MHDETQIAVARSDACQPDGRPATLETRARPRDPIRELAERASNGTRTRLLWLQGTSELWVEVYEPEFDVTIVIPAEPARALDTFHHPYAYVTADH